MDSYPAPATQQRSELEIKRSRFITTAGYARDKKQARHFIDARRQEMPDANHHCWAMVAGQPDDIYQQDQSDDGEPKGTAGKPMLNVLHHSGIGNIVVVVTRYFGGIKLGSGGLVRAYTQSVTESLKTLATERTFISTKMQISLEYSAFNSFIYWMQNTNIIIIEKQFQQSILLTIQTPESARGALKEQLNKLAGTVVSEDLGS